MKWSLFNLDNFNVISDSEYYYFFRALEDGDNRDIRQGVITDEEGNFLRLRTDRERYSGEAKYTSDSELTLEEIFDHTKIHYRHDTNCISLTSDSNVALMYGREVFQDNYVMIKVPKEELSKDVVFAGPYMMQEIEKRINKLLRSNKLSETQKYYIERIKNSHSQADLDQLRKEIMITDDIDDDFERGIVFGNTTSRDYSALNAKQNLEKNKIVAILDVLGENIIPHVSNKFLIQTVGSAFSSMEFTYYNDIPGSYVTSVSKEFMDVFSLIQQLPKNIPNLDKLKQFLITQSTNSVINEPFNIDDSRIDVDSDYTIDNMYSLTGGNVDYYSSIELYRKSFYLAKSKLRALDSLEKLGSVIGDNNEFRNVIAKLKDTAYGIEPDVLSRVSNSDGKISESVHLDFKKTEQELFEFVSKLNEKDLRVITDTPLAALQFYLRNFKSIEHKKVDKETYYANAIIDMFDWSRFNIVNMSPKNRYDLITKLKESHVLEKYEQLKTQGIKEKDIANLLLTNIIKSKDINEVDLNDTFTLEELEDFLGYYKIKGTELKLRSYQALAVENIDKIFETKQFAAAILPTGAGKSFVALAEMLKFKDKKIMYIAPNDEILNQIEAYIIKYIYGDFVNTKEKNYKQAIKEIFPNLELRTYTSLSTPKGQALIKEKYDLIVLDELHRTGANEWEANLNTLMSNQADSTKVLGLTATPQRDVDYRNMAAIWAERFGYTEEEIKLHKHLAINMDLNEAIRLGYVINPKVVECDYNLESELESLQEKINSVTDEEEKKVLIKRFDKLRKDILSADGVAKVLGDNVKKGGKYIVFCPIFNESGELIEDLDGNVKNVTLSGEEVIQKYTQQIKEYLKEYYQLSDDEIESMVDFSSMLGTYSKTTNKKNLDKFSQKDDDKIKFMVVMNKLNEGVHIDSGVDGIVWFRPLDENSKILCLQQFGRIITATDPNKPITDDEIPIAIDLAGNLLRVKLDKDKKTVSSTTDLDRLIMIKSWIERNGGEIPNLNSRDRIEASYGSSLKRIQEKYSKYLNDSELSIIHSEILKLGSDIGLWEYDFPEKIKDSSNQNQESLFDDFSITGLVKDYCDLSDDLDKILGEQLSLARMKEIVEVVAQHDMNKVPNTKNKEMFSDGSAIIGQWISDRKNFIIDQARAGNEYAIFICRAKQWEEFRTTLKPEERLKEIVEVIAQNDMSKVPKVNDKRKFSDGSTSIGQWIFSNSGKNYILEQARAGNEYAIFICRAKQWEEFRTTLKPEERLKEIVEVIAQNDMNKVPTREDTRKFSDGSAIIGQWIYSNNGKNYILEQVRAGNEYAIFICRAKQWEEFRTTLKPEERLKEIVEIVAQHDMSKIPKGNDKRKFSDDSGFIGRWIDGNGKKYILEQARAGNEYAIFICRAKQWEEFRTTLKPEERLKEIVEVVAQHDMSKVPTREDTRKFSDGTAVIVKWIQGVGKDYIIEQARAGNKYAIFICSANQWEEFRTKLTDEERLKEIVEVVAQHDMSKVPNSQDTRKFSDGSATIGSWIYDKHQGRNYIIEQARAGNEYAIFICRAKQWEEFRTTLKPEERLKEIVEVVAQNDMSKVPNSQDTRKFSDGSTTIGSWIYRKNQGRPYILEQARAGNEYAIFICKAAQFEEFNKSLTDEERLKEIVEVVAQYDISKVPKSGDKVRFSDDSGFIVSWINNRKNYILGQARAGNENAIFVCRSKQWEEFVTTLTDGEKLKEIVEVVAQHDMRKVPKQSEKVRFSDDSVFIGTWIYDKDRGRPYILEQARAGNEYAIFICRAKQWEEFGTTLKPEERLKEIVEVVAQHDMSKVPKQKDRVRFSDDSVFMGQWIGEEKGYIIDQARSGNEYAIFICRAKQWEEFRTTLKPEERLKEIVEVIAQHDMSKVPKANDQVTKFSDGYIIGQWIYDKDRGRPYILEQARAGNEYAIFICRAKQWEEFGTTLKPEERLKEIVEVVAQHDMSKVPKSNDKITKFSDGCIISQWIYNEKRGRLYIIEQAKAGNPYAMFIVQAKRWEKLLQAQEELNSVSEFNKAASSIEEKKPRKDKGKKENGRKI